jgi:hypothetical protein
MARPIEQLPGADLVAAGIADLERGVESVEALLVSIGAPRLGRLGFDVRSPFPSPEHRLYELLAQDDPDAAHSRYNALIRRLVSFERAAERAVSARDARPPHSGEPSSVR